MIYPWHSFIFLSGIMLLSSRLKAFACPLDNQTPLISKLSLCEWVGHERRRRIHAREGSQSLFIVAYS